MRVQLLVCTTGWRQYTMLNFKIRPNFGFSPLRATWSIDRCETWLERANHRSTLSRHISLHDRLKGMDVGPGNCLFGNFRNTIAPYECNACSIVTWNFQGFNAALCQFHLDNLVTFAQKEESNASKRLHYRQEGRLSSSSYLDNRAISHSG